MPHTRLHLAMSESICEMEDWQKELLRQNLVKLTADLDPIDIYDQLIEGDVFTFEDKERIDHEVTRADKARELISVLCRKGPRAFGVFRDALKPKYPYLYALLSAEMSAADDCLRSVCSELRDYYKDKLCMTFPMPWLLEKPLRLTDVHVTRALVNKSKETEVEIDHLFANQDNPEIPQRLLIEGDPGIGKSILCQFLAYEWSHGSRRDHPRELAKIHKFDLVFYLKAEDLKHQDSIAEAIRCHLLPKDFKISSDVLEELLKTASVLFLIDAYDEGCVDNSHLDQLIEKKHLRKSSLLLTSRRHFLRHKLNCFNCLLSLEGYDKTQQLNHVKKLAEHENIPVNQFDLLLENDEISGICSNPLYLTLLCLLYTEEGCSINSRTDLFCAMHEFILLKASGRMNVTQEDMEQQVMRPLYKLAFDAYQKNEYLIQEHDLQNTSCGMDAIIQVGYLIKHITVSRLQAKLQHRFTHTTVMEFLAAKHLSLMAEHGRQVWWQKVFNVKMESNESAIARLSVPILWNKSTETEEDSPYAQDETVAAFVFGLLETDPENLVKMATTIMNRTRFSGSHRNDLAEIHCYRAHIINKLICELHILPPALEDAIIQRCPSHMSFSKSCSVKCLKGLVIICNLKNMKPRSISVDITQMWSEFDRHFSLLIELSKCQSIDWIWIAPEDNKQLKQCLLQLRLGQADCIPNVKITRSESIREIAARDLRFGDKLRGLHLQGFDEVNTRRYLEAVSQKTLTTLEVADCDLDDKCRILLSKLMLNPNLQHVTLMSGGNHMGQFIHPLARLPELRSLQICLTEMNPSERKEFEVILKKNTLQELCLVHCGFYVHQILSNNYSNMTSLRELRMRDADCVPYNSLPMHPILQGIQHLNLRVIILRLCLRDDDLIALSNAMSSWPNLQVLIIFSTLPLSDILSGDTRPLQSHGSETTIRRLFRAITGCQYLKTLYLYGIQIQDSSVYDFCKMVDSLGQLNEFDLVYIYDDTLTKDANDKLVAYLMQKQDEMILWYASMRLPDGEDK
ncbi:hypothetical protein CAPTEDRAFT_200994 [Capitella teleta]|uniref:CARD domain-containing protein n=1 Tax=Capitella teleta TaxID=283909 RepID=R7UVL4_CAPTE|nr:hypothetical protein CAPTEDRAFT_200994 [Capitella teleta]|eukprot:ELU10658.1 hypothetical protein CAPTEDRAFT_200994 [Capitella teleta]